MNTFISYRVNINFAVVLEDPVAENRDILRILISLLCAMDSFRN